MQPGSKRQFLASGPLTRRNESRRGMPCAASKANNKKRFGVARPSKRAQHKQPSTPAKPMDFGSSAGTSPVARLHCGHLHLADLASPVINVGITQPPVSGTVWGGDTDLYGTRKAAIRFEASEHKLTDQICTTRRHAQNVLGQSKQLTGANLERTRAMENLKLARNNKTTQG